MKRIISLFAVTLIFGCAATTTNLPQFPQYGNGYDRAAEDAEKQQAVKNELDARTASSYDEQTRRDLERSIERNRSK